jgi:hypothetical protein
MESFLSVIFGLALTLGQLYLLYFLGGLVGSYEVGLLIIITCWVLAVIILVIVSKKRKARNKRPSLKKVEIFNCKTCGARFVVPYFEGENYPPEMYLVIEHEEKHIEFGEPPSWSSVIKEVEEDAMPGV